MLYVADSGMSGEGAEDSLVGAVLEGRFRIDRMLGEGGMGRVYVAEELRLRRRCAVKVLLPEVMADPANLERFLREAQAIAQLRHDNIVDVYHLGEDQERGVVFFAMELLEGEDLETRLLARRQRPVSWVDVARWGAEIAGAMAAVHAAGLVHRDLKPSNIFLVARRDGREQVKLLDFGIAKLVHYAEGDLGVARTVQHMALTSTGAAIGTPYYMSPEQLLGENLDGRTDVYSLGVVLYEALSDRLPFGGEPMQVAMQHCNVDPPSLSSLGFAGSIPAELEVLVMKMLAKEREGRPQTMDEVEAALLAILPAGTATTRPPLEPGPKPTPSMSPTLVFNGAKLVRAPRAPARPPPRPRSRAVPVLVGVGVVAAIIVAAILASGGEPPAEPAKNKPIAPQPAPVVPVPPVDRPAQPAGASAGGATIGAASAGATGAASAGATTGGPGVADPTAPGEAMTGTAEPAGDPGGKGTAKVERPVDPIKQITRAAAACRRQHKAGSTPKIVVDYAIGGDGSVTRAKAETDDALGGCLAEAVKKAKFPPEFKLGQKIEL